MNIDVKNALNKLMMECVNEKTTDGKSAEDLLAQDIYNYISSISLDGSEDRFNYFSKVYLGGKYKAEDFSATQSKETSELQALLRSIDSKNKKVGSKASKNLAALFTAMGRDYLSNSFDRKAVDISRSIDYINNLNSLIDLDEPGCKEGDAMIGNQQIDTAQSAISGQYDCAKTDEQEAIAEEPEESLEELLQKLNALIGLDGVKKEVNEIINMIKVKKKGEEMGIEQPPLSLHLVFYGNPGTGKTTVARILAKIYKRLGVLSVGQLVEVDRGGLVAGYVGQTATKTQEVIDKAMGGILFIDEAYSLTHAKGETDFGQEAVDTILKAMEDHRDDFIVIVAGYPDLMKEFIASNPGLKSRFNQFIRFEDYDPSELYEIFCLFCRDNQYHFDEECVAFLKPYFEQMYENRKEDFANGRDVRNFFDKVQRSRSNRLAESDMDNISPEEYLAITVNDLREAVRNITTI